MKKVIIGLFALASATSYVRAQETNVLSSWEYMQVYSSEKRNGNTSIAIDNLLRAKEAIDLASENEKTAFKSKTWKRKSEVYLAILKEQDPKLQSYKTNILGNLYDYVTKALTVEINPKNNKPKVFEEPQLMGTLNFLCDTLSKTANVQFEAQDYEGAEKSLEKRYSLLKAINYTDTLTYENLFMLAYRTKDYDKALKIGNDLMSMNYVKPSLYGTMARIYQEKGDGEKGLQLIKDARAKYPQNTEFITEELNFYLSANDNENVVRLMDEAIKAFQGDNETLKALYFNSGVIYGNLAQLEKSRGYYEKTLEVDPKHYGALNNLASSYLTEANAIIKEANDLDWRESKKFEELKVKANGVYKQAGDLLEKAYEVKVAEIAAEKDAKMKAYQQSQLDRLKTALYEIFSKMGDEAKVEKYK